MSQTLMVSTFPNLNSLGFHFPVSYRDDLYAFTNCALSAFVLVASIFLVQFVQKLRPGPELIAASSDHDFHRGTVRGLLTNATRAGLPLLFSLHFMFLASSLVIWYAGLHFNWQRDAHFLVMLTLEFSVMPLMACMLILRAPRLPYFHRILATSGACLAAVIAAGTLSSWIRNLADAFPASILRFRLLGFLTAELMLVAILALLLMLILRKPRRFVEQLDAEGLDG
ncbi:MAG: hypothetical protein R3F46_05820 [bacterium]